MTDTVINYEKLNEFCKVLKHPSGLTVYLCPKNSMKSCYTIIGTKFGSVNRSFFTGDGMEVTVNDGIAHFLEHKLFENEDGDAFEKYAQTGANANAYTSFDRTCYLFSCSDRFKENLEILLGFVTSPYFTPETVQKEQGIIGQEIRMYDDSPSWVVLFNLLKALYKTHPVKIDIAGTTETIAKITDTELFSCYNTFYNPSNMFLCIAGNFDETAVYEALESVYNGKQGSEPRTVMPKEDAGTVKEYVSRKMSVSMPLFYLGIKDDEFENSPKMTAVSEILLEIICGKASELYEKLTDRELINDQFGTEYFYGPGYSSLLFCGESKDPKTVKDEIMSEVERIKREGISEELFESVKRKLFGRKIRCFDSAEDTVLLLVDAAVNGYRPFDDVKVFEDITIDDVNRRAASVITRNAALSVVEPADGVK